MNKLANNVILLTVGLSFFFAPTHGFSQNIQNLLGIGQVEFKSALEDVGASCRNISKKLKGKYVFQRPMKRSNSGAQSIRTLPKSLIQSPANEPMKHWRKGKSV